MRSLVLLALAGCAGSRAEEAFALGQLGMAWDPVPETQRAAAEAKLVRRLSSEPDPEVRDRMVEALGKLGGDSAVQALSGQLSGAQRARAAVALGLLFKNGKLKEPMTGLGALIEDSDDEVRYSAAYALFRMKQPLDRCLNDRSWLVRATCARSAIDPRALAEKIGDPDERVAAEAGRSLAKLAVKCASDQPCAALEALAASGNWRPQVAAAIAFEPVTHPAAVGLFSSRAGNDCQLALAHDRALGRVDLLDRCHGDERRRAVLAARALGEGHGEVAQLLPLAAHHEAAVRAAAAEALGKLALPAADEALRRLLGDRDLTVLAATAEAVAERRVAGTEAALLLRLAPLGGPDAIEAIQGLCHALAALGARSAISELQRRTRDPHAALRSAARAALKELGQPLLPELPSVSPRIRPPTFARVQLETTRGTVILRLGHAPRTVDNFLKLVAARFYDGLLFHRVVPNFVAQGGDPRGDGSGGPGWTIPCEINPTRYREGTVGMALSGRDTGGSQFFIALSPQPHLDGRYTFFGEVESGFPAVRALEEGDRILSARVLR